MRTSGFAAFTVVLLYLAGCAEERTQRPPCAGDSVVCDGACARLATDNANCGACGEACDAGEVCSNGVCAVSCAAPLATCGAGGAAFCADTRNDPAHCGGCDLACPDGQVCSGGTCAPTCAAPLTTCGEGAAAFCADTRNDPAHCGSCDRGCAPGEVCSAGACATTCDLAGGTQCGDRCVELQSDDAHCGSCAVACGPGTSCQGGRCAPTCPTGQVRCGDRCVSLSSDAANCGACGNACPVNGFCVAGACTAAACLHGFGLPGQPDLLGGPSETVASGDLDGDGLADVVYGARSIEPWGYGTEVTVLRNLGGRRFAAPASYPVGFPVLGALLGDVDGDGHLDVVALGEVSSALLRGHGDGTFAAPTSVALGASIHSAAAVADLDADGRAELIVANSTRVRVARGRASGFEAPVVYSVNVMSGLYPDRLALGDVDGDGDPDVIAGSWQSHRVGIFRNTGGVLEVPDAATLADMEVEQVAAADVDGDGRDEVLAVGMHGTPPLPGRLSVYSQDDAGGLVLSTSHELPWLPMAIAAGDATGDGRPEIAVGIWGDDLFRDVRAILLFRNEGDGTFAPGESYYEVGTTSLEWGDLDADGRVDLAVASRPGLGVRFLWNGGAGRLEAPPLQRASPGPAPGWDDVTLVDLDADRQLDAIGTDAANGLLHVFHGAGGGTFTPGAVLDEPSVLAVRTGDLDGDGRPDLVLGRGFTSEVLLARDGGFVSASPFPEPGPDAGQGFELVDLDRDGNLDVVSAARWWGPTHVWRGLGDGTFAAAVPVGPPIVPYFFATADLDGNGWLDLVLVGGGAIRVAPGLGALQFAAPTEVAIGDAGLSPQLAFADLNRDGHTDVALAGDDRLDVLLGNGDGTLAAPQSRYVYQPRGLTAAGFPGLGREVLAVRDRLTEGLEVFEVNAAGVLQEVRRWTTQGGAGLAVGDVDGDLRPDAVLGAVGGLAVLPAACLP